MPKRGIYSGRLGGREVWQTRFQPSLDDGQTEDHDFDAWFKVTVSLKMMVQVHVKVAKQSAVLVCITYVDW